MPDKPATAPPSPSRRIRKPTTRKDSPRTVALHIVDDMQTMQLPFFALQEGNMDTLLFYDSRQRLTKIMPSALGRPTVRDKDLLLYVYTLLRDALSRGETPTPTIPIQVREFLLWAEREPSGAAYKHIASMLVRLQYSPISTEIPTGGLIEEHFFSFLSDVLIQRDMDDAAIPLDLSGDQQYVAPAFFTANKASKVRTITVTLSPWCFRMLLAHETLAIAPAYLGLRSPLERRLFELSAKHVGNQPEWRCSLDKLRTKTGYGSEIRFFRRDLKAIIKKGPLGGLYTLSFASPTLVVVKKATEQPSKPLKPLLPDSKATR